VLELLTVPNVAVTDLFVCREFNGATPPNAHPLLPLPGLLTPGIPAPAYAILISIHPFALLVESIVLPGNATHNPAIVPDHLTSNLDTDVLIILNVKYCDPVRPALKLGPAGK
jgi:hypothetical protein